MGNRRIWDTHETLWVMTGESFSSRAELANYTNASGRKPFAFAGIPSMDIVIGMTNMLTECSPITVYTDRARAAGKDVEGKTGAQILELIDEIEAEEAAAAALYVSPEERTAAALEFQNIMALPDAE